MLRIPRNRGLLAWCIGATLIAGCQKPQEPPKPAPPPPPAQAPPAQAPAAQAPFKVTRLELGNQITGEKHVTVPTTVFKPGDTIYVSVLSEGKASTVTLAVRWTYEDGQLVSEGSQTIAPAGPAATEFHIAKPDGWPPGKYTVKVTADGQPAGSLDFTVAP